MSWYYHDEASMCLPFINRNCTENGNIFKTKIYCQERCAYSDPPFCAYGADPYVEEGASHSFGQSSCDTLTCPNGYQCEMGMAAASCCNSTVEKYHEEAWSDDCTDGSKAYSLFAGGAHTFDPLFGESCDDLICTTGFECKQINPQFAKCCATTNDESLATTDACEVGAPMGVQCKTDSECNGGTCSTKPEWFYGTCCKAVSTGQRKRSIRNKRRSLKK